jgi:hypothetical protein
MGKPLRRIGLMLAVALLGGCYVGYSPDDDLVSYPSAQRGSYWPGYYGGVYEYHPRQ